MVNSAQALAQQGITTNANTVIASPIQVAMCGIDITVKRPSGRVQIKNVEAKATDDHGVQETLDASKITKPCFIFDGKTDHRLWSDIDANKQALDAILARYSVNDPRKGFHLVPMGKLGQLLAELREKRQERLNLAAQLAAVWEDEVIPCLREKYNGHFYLLATQLPNPASLVEKMDVFWTLAVLTPISASTVNFDAINDTDRAAIIAESNNMAKHLVQQRAKAIYDQVFGNLLTACDQIAAGAMQTGKRKFGAITELVDQLQRLQNFHEFASPEVVQRAQRAMSLVSGITDISSINANDGDNQAVSAIKGVFKPLGDSIVQFLQAQMPEIVKSRRKVSF